MATRSEEGREESQGELSERCSVANLYKTWHTRSRFLADLAIEVRKVDGTSHDFGHIRAELGRLLLNECDCSFFANEGTWRTDEASAGNDTAYCREGKMQLETREFIVLEQWIEGMKDCVEEVVYIRDMMRVKAATTRAETEKRLSLLDPEERQRARRRFPWDIYLDSCDDDSHSLELGDESSRSGTPDDDPGSTGVAQAEISSTGQIGMLLQNLPSELLHEIVVQGQAFDPHFHFTLSHINRYFRAFVNDSPTLWSHIDGFYPTSIFSLYCERSLAAKLDVVFDGTLSTPPSRALAKIEVESFAHLRFQLFPHRHRIQWLKIQAKDAGGWVYHRVSSLADVGFLDMSEMHSLQYLDLSFGDWGSDSHYADWPVVGTLRELRLCRKWPPPVIQIAPPTLKRLTLGDPDLLTLRQLQQILQSLPGLEALSFYDFIAPVDEQAIKVVELPSLKSLELVRCSTGTIEHILQTIACPHLQQLKIDFVGEIKYSGHIYKTFLPVDVTPLLLFRSPYYQLHRVELLSFTGDPSALNTVIVNLPAVRELRLGNSALKDEHLEALVVGTVGDALSHPCPFLISLTLDNELYLTSRVVRRIAESRFQASIPLRSVAMRGFDVANVSLDDIYSIRESGVAQLDVTVFGEEEAVVSEQESSWSSSWSTDEEWSEDEASGDEVVRAR